LGRIENNARAVNCAGKGGCQKGRNNMREKLEKKINREFRKMEKLEKGEKKINNKHNLAMLTGK